MGPEVIPEPWNSFLAEIDRMATSDIDLRCIGGFAVSIYHGFARHTGDIDVIDVTPHGAIAWLSQTAGEGSPLHKQYRIYLQIVTIAAVPYWSESRLNEIFPGRFEKLRLFVLDPYDLALSKLTRSLDVDTEDVKHLARSNALDLALLDARYREELRPYVSGSIALHDQTLRPWIEAIREERGEGPA